MLKTRQIVVYRGSVVGLIISSVDGTAFVDNIPAGILTLPLDGTHSLEIYDSSSRFCRGVLKEIGSGQTFQTEV